MQGELSGQTLGNYRLESILGRGGMGVVYRAEQISLGRTVAVKVIAPALAQDPMLRGRFKREAQLAASLDHPNVLPIHEADEAEGLLYIAMRYVEGVDLGDAIRHRGRMSSDEATGIVMQIAGALDAAHSRGLVHRDVKPANVLLSGADSPVAYLTDFGLTKHVGAVSGPTQSGQFVGTPDYAAPEQIQGHTVNAATDVYALGCVLHEALTGVVPFPRESNVAKMFAHISEAPPRASDLVEGINPALDDVIARALSKDPGERHPSAGDLGRAALAAATNRRAPSNEHSVAVGEAALAPGTVQRPSVVPTQHLPPDTGAPPPAAATPPAVAIHRAGQRRSSRGLVALTALAIAALLAAGAVAAFVLTGNRGKARPDTAAAAPQLLNTVTLTQTTQPTPGSGPDRSGQGRLPDESRAQMTTEITDLLRRFYQVQIDRNYGKLRTLTTKRYQREKIDSVGFTKWVENQQTGAMWFKDAQNIDVSIKATDPADGTVTVSATGMGYTQQTSDCTLWEGITWVRWEHGQWLYDPSVTATAARKAKWAGSDAVIGSGCIVF
ncbi:MAG: hypothetical protein QOJ57_1035 [Thermoleophilaceae bacterium]|nr:hypothetical protein [Thermoleophilaceae bacterium]